MAQEGAVRVPVLGQLCPFVSLALSLLHVHILVHHALDPEVDVLVEVCAESVGVASVQNSAGPANPRNSMEVRRHERSPRNRSVEVVKTADGSVGHSSPMTDHMCRSTKPADSSSCDKPRTANLLVL